MNKPLERTGVFCDYFFTSSLDVHFSTHLNLLQKSTCKLNDFNNTLFKSKFKHPNP